MRAGIYLRQSIDNTEGIDRQRDRTHALVKARGWTLAAEFTDNETSASKRRGEGTGWARMLESDIDVVVAVDLDRLLRDVRDLSTLIDTGKKVVTVDGEIDLSTADGEFRATMLAGIARFEVRRKSERQRRANEKRAASGKWVGGRRPFGFDADGVAVRDGEAAAIRSGYRAVLAGVPLAAVARDWNEKGFVTAQKRYRGARDENGKPIEPSPWRADAVRNVLLNPRYIGRVRYKGEIMTAPAEWPALVDDATYEAVKAILNDPSRRTSGRNARHLLTGIAVCGVCGATVHAGGNARRGVPAYRCSGSLGHFARMAEPVDKFVTDVAIARLSRPDARKLLLRSNTTDTEALHLESVGLRERLESLAVDYADGALTGPQLRAGTERIKSRLAVIEAELADAGRVDVLGELVAADDARAVWELYGSERQRAAISALMRVTLYPPGRGVRTFRPESVGIDWVSDPE